MDPMTKAFVADIRGFVAAWGLELVSFGKERKDDVAAEFLAGSPAPRARCSSGGRRRRRWCGALTSTPKHPRVWLSLTCSRLMPGRRQSGLCVPAKYVARLSNDDVTSSWLISLALCPARRSGRILSRAGFFAGAGVGPGRGLRKNPVFPLRKSRTAERSVAVE